MVEQKYKKFKYQVFADCLSRGFRWCPDFSADTLEETVEAIQNGDKYSQQKMYYIFVLQWERRVCYLDNTTISKNNQDVYRNVKVVAGAQVKPEEAANPKKDFNYVVTQMSTREWEWDEGQMDAGWMFFSEVALMIRCGGAEYLMCA